ncbi:PucR family transcriptional regulator [Bacillus piscicola]|uniref:PucR family transcriptional regulator n=1 Tax=Bacillus piscicola TaxID=1632684 RepID=UPI001F08DE9E|nr:PucR family transcriptional regulator [Bacillus piscicola]
MAKVNLKCITVGDFLNRPYFQEAEVIASSSALKREVKWVHVMDSTNVGHLLNGGELILSTGLGWRNDEETCLSFFHQLIENDCAGLCIELVAYTKELPESAIQLAKKHDFPLILFHKEVRYIDITQDHYAIFLNYHHKMVTELERLSALLNQSLLSGKNHISLLKEFYQFTGLSLLFQPTQGEPMSFPSDLKEAIQKHSDIRAIKVMNHTMAYLTIYSAKEFGEFEKLAADRVEIALAQELMRSMYVEERKRRKEELWLQRWLSGEYKDKEIRTQLQSIYPDTTFTSLVVCLGHHKNDNSSVLGDSMITRSLFEARGFTLIKAPFQEQTVYLLLSVKESPAKQLYEEIADVFAVLRKDKIVDTFAVGQPQTNFEKLNKSYETAQIVQSLERRLTGISPIYEQLHAYRIVYFMEKNHALEDFVNEYLVGIVQHDKRRNSELLLTLKSYMKNNGNKQETAKDLFIVRQTLYQRLRKIEEIIGADFFDYHKRLALEMALLGYEYLHGTLDGELNRS